MKRKTVSLLLLTLSLLLTSCSQDVKGDSIFSISNARWREVRIEGEGTYPTSDQLLINLAIGHSATSDWNDHKDCNYYVFLGSEGLLTDEQKENFQETKLGQNPALVKEIPESIFKTDEYLFEPVWKGWSHKYRFNHVETILVPNTVLINNRSHTIFASLYTT